jgi:hypothetical protein
MLIIKHAHDDEELYFMKIDESYEILWTEDKDKAQLFEEYFTEFHNPIEIVQVLDQIADSGIFPIIIEKV